MDLRNKLIGVMRALASVLTACALVLAPVSVAFAEDGAPTVQSAAESPRYMLTNIGQATTAKIQSPWGACWAFAVAGAIESSILKAETALLGQEAVPEISPAYAEPSLDALATAPDISERAIAWFAHELQTEASGGAQAGEGFYLMDDAADEQLSGGNFAVAASALIAWQSLVSEEAAPYQYNGYSEGSSPWYETSGLEDARYEDWSLPDDIRTLEDVGWRVTEVLRLQSPAMMDRESFSYTGYDPEATDAIKRTLVDVGGVAASISMEQNLPQDVLSGSYESAEPSEHFTYSTWSAYNAGDSASPNHAAVILGWDDTYPASAFEGVSSGSPPGDGAWLCKNSWGNDALYQEMGADDDAPHWGIHDSAGQATGYFWLSYFDHTLSDLEAFRAAPVQDSADVIYQHDYLGAAEYVQPMRYGGQVRTANAFEADAPELLTSVGSWTFLPNTSFTATVRTLPVGFDAAGAEPDELMLASTEAAYAVGTFADAGYHTVQLDQPVLLSAGQPFLIELVITAAEDGSSSSDTFLGLEIAYDDSASDAQTTLASVVANPGETFVSDDGRTWQTLEQFVSSEDGSSSGFTFGNAVVKGFANATSMTERGQIYQEVALS